MGNDKPASAPPADRERVIVEMRHAAELLGDTQVADDLLEWADQIEALATSAQGREVEANCRGSWQLGNNCKRCPRCLSTMSAAEPAPVAQDWHVRHLGAGLLAQYHGDEYVRDIGGTVGWDFKDRDEFIVRYNDHADHARIVALGDMQYEKLLAKYEATEASLAACRAEHDALLARVANAPVARVETDGFADDGMPIVCLAADSIKAERAIKKLHMQRVRVLPLAGEVANG